MTPASRQALRGSGHYGVEVRALFFSESLNEGITGFMGQWSTRPRRHAKAIQRTTKENYSGEAVTETSREDQGTCLRLSRGLCTPLGCAGRNGLSSDHKRSLPSD